MTTYKHIVQVHPVENGEVNLSKVEFKLGFSDKESANWYISTLNDYPKTPTKAVYLGRVNDATGELE